MEWSTRGWPLYTICAPHSAAYRHSSFLAAGGDVGPLRTHVEGCHDHLGALLLQGGDGLADHCLSNVVGGVDADGQTPIGGVQEGLTVSASGHGEIREHLTGLRKAGLAVVQAVVG